MIKERKEIFASMGITSFTSYKEAGHSDLPNVIVMIDNFLALKELYPEYDDDLLYLCREGTSVGISMILTTKQSNGISYKYLSNIPNRITLYCNSADEYRTVFDRCRMQPKNVPGRGLVEINKTIYEFQTYLAFEGEREIDRVEAIKEYTKNIHNKYPGKQVKRIPEVPQVLDIDYVRTNLNSNKLKPYEIPVGIEYDTVEFVTVNLLRTQMLSVTGREGSGKTNLMKVIFHYLYQGMFDNPVKAYIIDDYRRQLDCLSSYGIVEKYSIDSNDFETILGEMNIELQQRMEVLQTSGYDALKDYPLLLCVVQNSNLFTATGLTKNGLELFKNILKNYKQLKVCFMFSEVDNVAAGYSAPELLKLVKDNKNVFAFDNVSNLKLIDVPMNALKQYKKEIELGDSYYITEKGIQKLKIIISKKEG